MLTHEQIESAAEQLDRAERTSQQIRALTLSYPQMDLDDAYAVQDTWVTRKIESGRKVIGYKIGLTSRAMQQVMNIDTPDYGVLLDDMQFENQGQVIAENFNDPRLEAELAFVLKKALYGTEVTLEQVLDATDYVVPALELIAARSYRTDPETGYTRTVIDTIADNAANAGIIQGDVHIDPNDLDLKWVGALVYLNDEVEESGLAGGVMGHPAHGIRWVCKRFAQHGIGLEPGQVILSGSFTRPIKISPGDSVLADYGPYGEISLAAV